MRQHRARGLLKRLEASPERNRPYPLSTIGTGHPHHHRLGRSDTAQMVKAQATTALGGLSSRSSDFSAEAVVGREPVFPEDGRFLGC